MIADSDENSAATPLEKASIVASAFVSNDSFNSRVSDSECVLSTPKSARRGSIQLPLADKIFLAIITKSRSAK